MRETLLKIAELIKVLPSNEYPRVQLGCGEDARAAVEALRGMPEANARTYLYDPPRVIETVSVVLDGVTFEASFGREPTAEERARIATDAREIAPACRAVH